MPHIAVVVSGLLGRMHSGFELISRLEREGHRVTCLCQPYTTGIVTRQGFDYLEIPEINFGYSDFDADSHSDSRPDSDSVSETDSVSGSDLRSQAKAEEASWFRKWVRHIKNRRVRYEHGKKRLKLSEYEKIWAELKPDHVLADVELHDLIFTAYAAQIPVTLFHTWFSDTPSTGLPPIRSSITPGQGFGGSTFAIAWARWVDWAKIQGRRFINILKFKEYRRLTIKQYAAEIGFPVTDLALSTLPPLYRFKKLPILLLALRELDFPHRPAQNISYVGPMVYENRRDLDPDSRDSPDSQEAQRLDEIFDFQKSFGKKLIYCAVGSLAKGDVPFLKKVIEAVGKEPDWLLILSLGRNLSEELFSDTPENVHLFAWVPQLNVLAHADACINHAGINSINECLHYAVPMLIYSLKYTDENGNAARMAYHGLALVGDKDEDGLYTIHKNIKTVLNDPKFHKSLLEFNSIYGEYRQRKLTPLIFRGDEN